MATDRSAASRDATRSSAKEAGIARGGRGDGLQWNRIERAFFEVRPGFDAVRYLMSFGMLTLLARRATKCPQRCSSKYRARRSTYPVGGPFRKGRNRGAAILHFLRRH